MGSELRCWDSGAAETRALPATWGYSSLEARRKRQQVIYNSNHVVSSGLGELVVCNLALSFYARGPSPGEATSLSERLTARMYLNGRSPRPGAPPPALPLGPPSCRGFWGRNGEPSEWGWVGKASFLLEYILLWLKLSFWLNFLKISMPEQLVTAFGLSVGQDLTFS